ncbi:MAG TPA: hypothetical protein DEA08_33350 [Planctomycetes bacterium]|nr:hypothetical protein [Planctomycetota bacterium]
MSDDELQLLRRAWRERGDLESEAAWLRAALRAELISPDVVLARWHLGDSAAAQAVARAEPEEPDLAAWIRGLAAFDLGPRLQVPQVPAQGWGQPALVRASYVAFELSLDRLAPLEDPPTPLASLRVELAGFQSAAPLPAWPLAHWCAAFEGAPRGSDLEVQTLLGLLTLAQTVAEDAVVFAARALGAWLQVNLSVAHRAVFEPGQVAAVAVNALATKLSEGEVRAALSERLLAWLRERSDP